MEMVNIMDQYISSVSVDDLEPYTYDTFARIWLRYADFYRDREAYFDWAISLYQPSEA